MTHDATSDALPVLRRLGKHVRQRRGELQLTAQELARRAGLSRRFIAQIEAGLGNIAIGRLEDLAAALGVTIETLVAEPSSSGPRQAIDRLLAGRSDDELRRLLGLLELALGEQAPRAVALLGIRGAGKSTVGPFLAEALELPFVELDERIEAAAGLSLADIFAIHGEPYYRRLEARCVTRLLAERETCVVALPGGIVGNEEAWELVLRSCFCAWLKARPEDHMDRVLAQGDRRPMAGSTDAMAQLRALIASREPLYHRADVVVDTSASTAREVAARLVRAIEQSRWTASRRAE